MSRIAINRPGAIGDIIMISNCLPKLREKYDEVDLFCHPSIGDILGDFLKENEVVDRVGDSLNFVESNYDKVVNCTGYPLNEGYPDVKMKKHLVDYFADELGVEDCFNDLLFQLPDFPLGISRHDPYITIQNKTGWSVYKEWWGWQDLVNKIKQELPQIGIYQIGGPNDPPLVNIDGDFLGWSFEANLNAQVWSRAHLGLDSVFNHTSNIIWQGLGKKSCVILFGSTQHDASGYSHNTNISLQLPCQPCFRETEFSNGTNKGVCPTPPNQTVENPKHQCMADITVDMVYDAMVEILDRPRIIE
jgi:hypothetical protein